MPDTDRFSYLDDLDEEEPAKGSAASSLGDEDEYSIDDDPDFAEPGTGRRPSGASEGSGVDRLLTFREDQQASRAEADETFKANLAIAERLSPDWQEPPPPLTDIERAAQMAAADPSMVEEMTTLLREANERTEREARAGSEGFDADGEPVEPEVPFDANALDPAAFAIFMQAATRGSADPAKTPQGYTPSQWAKAVDSALGVER